MNGRLGAWIGLVAAALVAAPAQAAPEWHMGSTEQSLVGNCLLNPETGIAATAFFQSDPQLLPKVGGVFYVRTVAARVGSGCGSQMRVHVETVLPTGVTTAISSATPVRCQLWDFTADAYSALDGCPAAAADGVYGPAFDQLTPGGATSTFPWTVPYGKAVVIDVPLRSSRRLAGGGGGSPSCVRAEGEPPCRPEQAGDYVQFADKVIDGWDSPWLSPNVPVFVEDAPPGGGEGGSQGGGTVGGGPAPATPGSVAAEAPRRARVARLRRGLPIRVTVVQAGSDIGAVLELRGHTVARGSASGVAAGPATLRIRRTRAGARRLARLRRTRRARLTVTVAAPDGATAQARATIRLRP